MKLWRYQEYLSEQVAKQIVEIDKELEAEERKVLELSIEYGLEVDTFRWDHKNLHVKFVNCPYALIGNFDYKGYYLETFRYDLVYIDAKHYKKVFQDRTLDFAFKMCKQFSQKPVFL